MANTKRYEAVFPRSYNNSDYADYEYLLRWIGSDGADYLYMFYDAEFSDDIRSEVINKTESDNIESLILDEDRSITITASDVSRNDLLVFAQMFKNKYVTRLKKDGTTERYALEKNGLDYTLYGIRYNISITLKKYTRPIWR